MVKQHPGAAAKVDVPAQFWDNAFAPSSCLVMVTTVDEQGRANAGSYGTCTRVAHDPVFIAVTIGVGTDTYSNIQATGEFVVNVVPFEEEMLEKVLAVGLPFKPGVSELDAVGLTSLSSRTVRAPRIQECRTHFECKVEWSHQWLNRLMVCGRVTAVSIDEGCMSDDGFIVWDRVKPAHYCGSHYNDRFVPAMEPKKIDWEFKAGRDEMFREGRDWRNLFHS
jgi:flavin reductase (DIM6/NTAB) family NADH-FMN oxidoreductase RutF